MNIGRFRSGRVGFPAMRRAMSRAIASLATMAAVVLGMPRDGVAVSVSYWVQNSEADFNSGTADNVVATNLGDLKLSRAVKLITEQNPDISTVYCLAEAPDGTIYAGTGPHAVLLSIKEDKVAAVATLPSATAILSIVIDLKGAITLGTAGESAQILRLEKPGDEKPKVLFSSEGVQYIWKLALTPDGNLYAATGPHGQLFEIKPDGGERVLLESDESNLLSLVSDGNDLLYVGTDPHGLIYRVNRRNGDTFVVYNCAESEVSALALDKNGNLYAGTSEAREEPQPPAEAPATDSSGRPESSGIGVPIPSEKPHDPAPPAPNPNPGQPDPIPRTRGKYPSPDPSCAVAGEGVRPRVGISYSGEFSSQNARLALALTGEVVDDPPSDDPGPPSQGKKKPGHPGPAKPQPTPNPNPAPAKPSPGAGPAAKTPAAAPALDATATPEAKPEGNAIYKIEPDGFVHEVFRQPVLILGMIEKQGSLTVATGGADGAGAVYEVRPDAQETVVLAKVEPKEVMCLLDASDGRIFLGTANIGGVEAMSAGFAAHGSFSSPVLDATQISRFGKMHLHGTLPTGTTLTLATRSGNVREPDEKTWSKWSEETPATEYVPVASAAARFLQYRISFGSADGKATPVLRDVSVAYQMPNLPPLVKAIRIAASTTQTDAADADSAQRRVESSRHQTISWDAQDPNGDALVYTLYLREVGQKEWIVLKDKLTETTYEWDTRATADGRYEVKVVASDANANPAGQGKTASRVGEVVTVDNTPPLIGDLKAEQAGAAATITLKAVDRTSTVAAVDYAIDSGANWQFVAPVGELYDSPQASVRFSIAGLSAGIHRITIRATDSKGNQSFANLSLTIEKEKSATKSD